jgi:membrane carboxypeptidase/penicillin-binding protein
MWTETVRAAGVGAARVAFDDRRADGTRLATLFLENRKAVPPRATAAVVKAATVAAEDPRLFTHAGIDVKRIVRAKLMFEPNAPRTLGRSSV